MIDHELLELKADSARYATLKQHPMWKHLQGDALDDILDSINKMAGIEYTTYRRKSSRESALESANTSLVCALDRIRDVLRGEYVDSVADIVNAAIQANASAICEVQP